MFGAAGRAAIFFEAVAAERFVTVDAAVNAFTAAALAAVGAVGGTLVTQLHIALGAVAVAVAAERTFAIFAGVSVVFGNEVSTAHARHAVPLIELDVRRAGVVRLQDLADEDEELADATGVER